MASGVRTRRSSQKASTPAPMLDGATPSRIAAEAEELQPLAEPLAALQQHSASRASTSSPARAPRRQPQHVLQVEQQVNGATLPPSFLLEVWQAEHHDLVLPSDTAFRALLILPLMFWWLCVLAGMSLHEVTVRSNKVHHALLWFDRGLLRPFGPLLPFGVILARSGLLAVVHWWDARTARHGSTTAAARAAGAGETAAGTPRPRLRLATLSKVCFRVYVAIALLRLAIYLLHLAGHASGLLPYDIMSDHIFLSATMLVCLHVEMLCVLSDLLRLPIVDDGSVPSLAELGLNSVFVTALFLYLLTAADMFFTARYYHHPLESGLTLVLVFFIFQLPALRWVAAQRRPREVVAGVVVVEALAGNSAAEVFSILEEQ